MITELIRDWCDENNIAVTADQCSAFEKYAELLIEWNKKMNLTAITEKNDIAIKHFIDSISLLKYAEIKNGSSVIDIGTGAGFPGIPLKIMRPDIKLTLLDSLNKRLIFLDEACRQLNTEAELIHARAEEYGRMTGYRDSFDYAVSRAVANLPSLCEYCMPFVRKGGYFISMKGPDGEDELRSSENAIKLLGGKAEYIRQLTLPDEQSRTIIAILKISATPPSYPRRGVKISKQPL